MEGTMPLHESALRNKRDNITSDGILYSHTTPTSHYSTKIPLHSTHEYKSNFSRMFIVVLKKSYWVLN